MELWVAGFVAGLALAVPLAIVLGPILDRGDDLLDRVIASLIRPANDRRP